MFQQRDEDEDKLQKSLYDVMSIYITLYNNLEIRVLDMNYKKMFTSREALDMIVSYSISEEGSNILYLHMISLMLQAEEPYSLTEIEMILNYFPHGIWAEDD